MRFHLTMFFMVIAVSLGMHAMAKAAPVDAQGAFPGAAAPVTCAHAATGN